MHDTAGYSLKERCAHFSRQFPDKVICPTQLRRLYLQHGIKKKRVRQTKKLPAPDVHNMMGQRQKILDKLKLAQEFQFPIVYLDETVMTSNSL